MNKKILALCVALLSAIPPAFGAAADSHGKDDTHAAPKAAPANPKEEAPAAGKEAAGADPRTNAAWQTLFVENGRKIEIDSASISKVEGKMQAYGRILFDKPLPDATSGGTYQILEALNSFDCDKRTITTHRRIYRKDEKTLLRDEVSKSKAELPVRSGTLDEKMLRAACRPGAADSKGSFKETVSKAKAAADAHAPEPRKEILRADLGTPKPKAEAHASGHAPNPKPAAKHPAADTGHAAPAKKPAAKPESFDHVHWAYEGRGGPENWGKLGPENKLCDTGTRQSPIDIREGIRVDLTPIVFSYRPSHFRIIDNGHTIQASMSDNRITVLGKDYELLQLHFHRPSEERVNGRNFDMVAHLVHKSFDGKLAVVAVLMERGSENPFIQTLWNYLPLERNQDVFPPGVPVDLNQLLPAKREYFTYMGSLTTPPCSEGVLWLVMQNPIQVSPEQIGIFSRLYPNNARPVQPTNGRLIKESR